MVPTLQTSPNNYGVSAFIGKSAATGQCASLTFGYNYTGSGTGTASSTNSLAIGIYGGKTLNIAGTGKVYTTGGNVLDDGAGNATVATALTITGNTLVNGSGNSITLPSSAGTLALTSQIPTVPTQYQAWGYISGTGSSCTIGLVGSTGGFTATSTALSFPAGPAQWLIHWSYTAGVPASTVVSCSLVLGSQTPNNTAITANGSNVSGSVSNITVSGQAILTNPLTMGFTTGGFNSSHLGASFYVKGLPN